MRSKKIFYPILIILLISAASCKKDEDTPAETSSLIFAGMSLYKTVLVPKSGSNTVTLNNVFSVSNQYVYGVNADGLYQMDFEGISTVAVPNDTENNSTYGIVMGEDDLIYITRFVVGGYELVSFNESSKAIVKYKFIPGETIYNFGIDPSKKFLFRIDNTDKFEIECYDYTTMKIVNNIGSNGTGAGQFATALQTVGSDTKGYVYVKLIGKDGKIFTSDGVFVNNISSTHMVDWHVWREGYYLNSYDVNETSFNNHLGVSMGKHVHNLGVNGYGFQEEISPDHKTAVIRNGNQFHIYKKP